MSQIFVLLSCLSLASAFVVPNAVFHTYRSQDELGGYHFGYSGGPSSRSEHRDHLGVVRGAYNLVDANGEVQRYQYISDALGYRLISGSHLPVAPTHVVPEVDATLVALVGPDPIEETPEVMAARAAFEAEFSKALGSAKAVNIIPVESSKPVEESPVEEAAPAEPESPIAEIAPTKSETEVTEPEAAEPEAESPIAEIAPTKSEAEAAPAETEVAPVEPEVPVAELPVTEAAPAEPKAETPVEEAAATEPEAESPIAEIAPTKSEAEAAPVEPEVAPVAETAPAEPEAESAIADNIILA